MLLFVNVFVTFRKKTNKKIDLGQEKAVPLQCQKTTKDFQEYMLQ